MSAEPTRDPAAVINPERPMMNLGSAAWPDSTNQGAFAENRP